MAISIDINANVIQGREGALALGRLSLSVAGTGDFTLASTQYIYPILDLTGVLTGNRNVILPLQAGAVWWVYNGTTAAYTLTVKGTTGTGIQVAQGRRMLVVCDGTNFYGAQTDSGTVNVCINISNGAADADWDIGVPWIADRAYEIVSVTERHLVAGTDGGAVTAMVKKVPSATAPSAGTDTLSAGLNLKATANTNQAGTLHGTQANYQLASGDGLALVKTGTVTTVDGVTVQIVLKPI